MQKKTAPGLALALTLAAVAPAFAAEPVAVVQVGDSALSCKALAAEINGLAQAQTQKAKQAQQRRSLMGFASGALQVAGPLMGNLGGGSGNSAALIGQLANQGAMTAAMSQSYASQPVETASPETDRLQRLNAIFVGKSC